MAADIEQPAHKFSRYRSVRKAHLPPVEEPAPPVPQEPEKSETLSRSMSRYHKQRPTTSGGSHVPSPPRRANTQEMAPPLPANAHATAARARATTLNSNAQQQQRVASRRGTANGPGPNLTPTTSPPRAVAPPLIERGTREPPKDARDEARQLLEAEAERQRKVSAMLQAEKRAQLEAEEKRARAEEIERTRKLLEAEETLAQQEAEKAKQQERLQQEQEDARRARAQSDQRREAARRAQREQRVQASPRTSPQSPQSSHREPPHSPSKLKEKLGFLRKHHHDAPRHYKSDDLLGQSQTTQREVSPPTISEAFIKAGGGGVVPGIDAPISAVNAGDRRVLIECNKSSIKLPVTPTTTSVDLIRSAETVMSENIDRKASILLESFGKVGVQRPLRRYEHVRDVMNSWDDDGQNSLVLVPVTEGAEEELEAEKVPKDKPEYSCYLYHSQKPGRWKKEWVTLRSDGQMLIAKNETGKDETTICHLSDFDIYSPTQRKTKSIKPPKKICFAIKSQQKSNMFMDTTNFVHFFCTSDRDVSTKFYKAVQGWRSWYLVNVMGEGSNGKPTTAASPFSLDVNIGSSSTPQALRGHVKSSSLDSHYELGSFQPLLDLSFDKMEFADPEFPSEQQKNQGSRAMHARKMSTRQKAPPPSAFPNHFSESDNPPQTQPLLSLTDNTFAPTGLLGRTYSQRQKAQRDRDAAAKNPALPSTAGPFTDGPSLLNQPATAPRTSIDASSSSGTITRYRSTHTRRPSSNDAPRPAGIPKPLVDLTPTYVPPPQHARKGRAFRPDPAAAGTLVDAATSPESAFPTQGSDWRAAALARARSNAAPRGQGVSAQALHSQDNPHAAERSADAFTGKGLLATKKAERGQGGENTGRGVLDRSRAKGPMVDLSTERAWSDGSLLKEVERREGRKELVIDRGGGGREVSVGTGEGV